MQPNIEPLQMNGFDKETRESLRKSPESDIIWSNLGQEGLKISSSVRQIHLLQRILRFWIHLSNIATLVPASFWIFPLWGNFFPRSPCSYSTQESKQTRQMVKGEEVIDQTWVEVILWVRCLQPSFQPPPRRLQEVSDFRTIKKFRNF